MIKFNIYSIIKFILLIGFIFGVIYLNYAIYIYNKKDITLILELFFINLLIIFFIILFYILFNVEYPFKIINEIDDFCKKERKIKYK